MKHLVFILIFLMTCWTAIFGQNQNNKWTFGYGVGIDFNSGVATPFKDSIKTESACASVSNFSGDLMFYTNGVSVWNRHHMVMTNGSGLLGDSQASVSQGAVIVPFVNDTNRFYIFYMKNYANTQEDDLYYSVVDMSLDNGLGDLVPGTKNTWIASGMSSALTTVPGLDCNVWLVTHMRQDNVVISYEINDTGINTTKPVVSVGGHWQADYAYETSVMKTSPNYDQIGISNFTTSQEYNTIVLYSSIELMDFNRATGQITGTKMLDSSSSFVTSLLDNFLSLEFSPDGSKLYACAPFLALYGQSSVFQYDLSLGNWPAIQASKTALFNPVLVSDLKRGPDGRIYVTSSFGVPATQLDVINDPNLPGLSCSYTPGGFSLQNGTSATTLLPTYVAYPDPKIFSNRLDTFVCIGDRLSMSLPKGYYYYYFQGQRLDTTTVFIDTPGVYYFEYGNYCERHLDTLHFGNYQLMASLRDTNLCSNAFDVNLNASGLNPAGTNYIWSDGTRGPSIEVVQPGSYWVEMSINGCVDTGYVAIGEILAPQVSLGSDTTICRGEMLTLEGPAADSFVWQNGSQSRTFDVKYSGQYSLTAYKDGCADSGAIVVSMVDCDCRLFVPNAFSPNGDGINDRFEPQLDCNIGKYSFRISIYNRWGKRIFISYRPEDSWDGTVSGQNADVGSYFYRIEYRNSQGQPFFKQGDLTLLR